MRVCYAIILSVLWAFVHADTPGNCTYAEIEGKWKFYIQKMGDDPSSCSEKEPVMYEMSVELLYPDVAVDEFGNQGFWTLIYNQGFEVVVNGRKYFAFSKYEGTMENSTSYCGETMPGWSHNVMGRDWTCYYGKKEGGAAKKRTAAADSKLLYEQRQTYKPNKAFIEKINAVQTTWRAAHYEEYENMTVADLLRRAGGPATGPLRPSVRAPLRQETARAAGALPANFDWRDVDGVNYVSPVRNQGRCGSCYAFSSMGMLEARIRVATDNKFKLSLSPQDVVECDIYSQGCDGGFPYLVGGKYVEDFGAVDETCNPYTGKDGACSTEKKCGRHYATDYRYVGGYYGACNEEEMKVALRAHGPMSVSFLVTDDFMNYKSGVYQHTGLTDSFNPFQLTNHAVLLVGWGEEETEEEEDEPLPFWIVKNSWGEQWGEDGYFRIVRGRDELAIESLALETFPIF